MTQCLFQVSPYFTFLLERINDNLKQKAQDNHIGLVGCALHIPGASLLKFQGEYYALKL